MPAWTGSRSAVAATAAASTRPNLPALYLADSEPTAWTEWYRWLAEWTRSPTEHLPRDLYRVPVELTAVGDLRTMAARQRAAAPGRMRPSSAQWPLFQEIGARLAAEGAQGILYASAARTRSLCLCVFEAGLEHLRVDGEPVTVITPPPPPRGLRTYCQRPRALCSRRRQ